MGAAATCVPPQAALLGVVVVGVLPEQRIADIEVDACVSHKHVGIDAGETVGRALGAKIASGVAGEAHLGRRIEVGLGEAGAAVDCVVEKVALGAVVGVIGLHIVGAVAVDGAEADGSAAGQAGEAVGRARAGPAAGDGLCAILALRASGVVEAADADAAARGEDPVPALDARAALGGERSYALEAGVGTGLHGRGRGLVVEGRAEAVAEIFGGDVELACGAGEREE